MEIKSKFNEIIKQNIAEKETKAKEQSYWNTNYPYYLSDEAFGDFTKLMEVEHPEAYKAYMNGSGHELEPKLRKRKGKDIQLKLAI